MALHPPMAFFNSENGGLSKANHLKARIELIGEADDIKKLSELLKKLKSQPID